MALIGVLIAFGTFLIVFGTVFASSAQETSRASIIDNFTGDFIVYSAMSRDLPSPFAFNTPLPRIKAAAAVEAALASMSEVAAYAPYAQNYGLIQAERSGKKVDLPFIFYAVEPAKYASVFVQAGASVAKLADQPGIMISSFQNEQYKKNFGFSLSPGEVVTLLGITEGGVNTVRSKLVGVFEPIHFTSVFNYINFMDADTFSSLYDYSGVQALPDAFNPGLAATSGGDESAIFGLASDPGLQMLDLPKLKSEAPLRCHDDSRQA